MLSCAVSKQTYAEQAISRLRMAERDLPGRLSINRRVVVAEQQPIAEGIDAHGGREQERRQGEPRHHHRLHGADDAGAR